MGDGAQGRNRTTDTAIFSRMLYQLSYLGIPAKRAALRLVRGDIEAWARAVQPTNDPAGGKISFGPAEA